MELYNTPIDRLWIPTFKGQLTKVESLQHGFFTSCIKVTKSLGYLDRIKVGKMYPFERRCETIIYILYTWKMIEGKGPDYGLAM